MDMEFTQLPIGYYKRAHDTKIHSICYTVYMDSVNMTEYFSQKKKSLHHLLFHIQ